MHAVLYRTQALADIQILWKQAVFDEERPHCMDVDVALASISDRVGYYAVPSVQDPGFLRETNHKSARWDINMAGTTTGTTTPLPPGAPSCASFGCVGYMPAHPCQCNALCRNYGNCCADYQVKCVPVPAPV